jgi:hypothetical protein
MNVTLVAPDVSGAVCDAGSVAAAAIWLATADLSLTDAAEWSSRVRRSRSPR